MRVIVCGGRKFDNQKLVYQVLEGLRAIHDDIQLVSGCCSGADALGEAWAEYEDCYVHRFPADWNTHGKAAGPIRNEAMAKYADACIAFPGGNGTADMVLRAKKHGLLTIEVTPAKHLTTEQTKTSELKKGE